MADQSDKDHVRQAFASRFRRALGEMGYTAKEQKAMSKLFGVSGQAVRKWAEGEAMPTPSRMPKVSSVLGVRRAWLQDGEEPMRPVVTRIEDQSGDYETLASSSEITLAGKELRQLLLLRSLNPRQRRFVEELISLLAETRDEQ